MQKLSKDLVKKLIYEALNETVSNKMRINTKLSKERIKIIIQEEINSHYGAR
jgi:hypothetical protein